VVKKTKIDKSLILLVGPAGLTRFNQINHLRSRETVANCDTSLCLSQGEVSAARRKVVRFCLASFAAAPAPPAAAGVNGRHPPKSERTPLRHLMVPWLAKGNCRETGEQTHIGDF
jgi:hypothetical protein